jgi:predicted RND superfamily exporter protein
MAAAESSISWDGLAAHGLQDVAERFVRRTPDGWSLATYAFPEDAAEIGAVRRAVAGAGGGLVLTGLPIVNEELGAGFAPQFAWGLAVGTIVVIASIVATFRDLRLSLLTLVPTAIGLAWAAGLLAIARVELDLFAVFAVITFVGIGVDYGIHLVHRYRERGDAATAVAELAPVILVAGAITLFGYGTLITSSYPPLRSIGVVSAVSVVTLVIASVLVLPALLHGRTRED